MQSKEKGGFSGSSLLYRSQGNRLAPRMASRSWLLGGSIAGRRSGCRLGRGKIAGDLVLADLEHDDLIGRHVRTALHVELHGLAGGLVLLLDGPVIGEDGHG